MNNIQNIDSTPDYISSFLRANMEHLVNIHDEGKNEYGLGCLGFKCSESENKMDVFYMNEELILNMVQKESWEQLKETITEKKLFLINDLDRNSIFLVYV